MSSSSAEASEIPTKTNSDGEIVMSIEESNKLRISLGLKPLRDSSSSSNNSSSSSSSNPAIDDDTYEVKQQQLKLKEKLAQAKEKRLALQASKNWLNHYQL